MQKYSVAILYKSGQRTILSHKDKTEFSYPTAQKYANEFTQKFGERTIIFDTDNPIPPIPARAKNPAPRIGTSRQKRPSQITGQPPTKRLVKRRRKNSVEGYFPNPINTSMVHGQRKEAVSSVHLNFYVYQKHDLGENHSEHKFVCACDHFRIAAELVKLLNANAQPRVRYIAVNTATSNIS